jgi:hypothetical protein
LLLSGFFDFEQLEYSEIIPTKIAITNCLLGFISSLFDGPQKDQS